MHIFLFESLRLMTEHFGVEMIKLVVGWSMGAQVGFYSFICFLMFMIKFISSTEGRFKVILIFFWKGLIVKQNLIVIPLFSWFWFTNLTYFHVGKSRKLWPILLSVWPLLIFFLPNLLTSKLISGLVCIPIWWRG